MSVCLTDNEISRDFYFETRDRSNVRYNQHQKHSLSLSLFLSLFHFDSLLLRNLKTKMEIVIYITMWAPREKEFPDRRANEVSSSHVKFRFDLSLSRSCERSLARGGMSCKIPARRFRFVNPCILERTRHLCHFSTIVYSVILRKRPVLHFIFPPPVFSLYTELRFRDASKFATSDSSPLLPSSIYFQPLYSSRRISRPHYRITL